MIFDQHLAIYRYVSETVQDRDIFTIEQELICTLLNGAISGDLD